MFTTTFDECVSDGDTITCEAGGFVLTATVYRDDDASPPWKRHDGHGPVSDWTSRQRAPGERILSQDCGNYRYYDVDQAVEIAKRDGWDSPPFKKGTKASRAARAVEADFAHLKAWCDDEWQWVGVAVTVSKSDVELTGKYDHAIWGIESSSGHYLTEVANEMVSEAVAAARKKLLALGVSAEVIQGRSFADWVDGVRAELATEIEPEAEASWKVYYDLGLGVNDAIQQSRNDDGVDPDSIINPPGL